MCWGLEVSGAGDLMERELRLGEAGDSTRRGASVSSWIVRSRVTGCQLLMAAGSSSIGVGMKGGKVLSSLTTLGWAPTPNIPNTSSSAIGLFAGLRALRDL